MSLALIVGACNGEQSSLPEDADPQLQTGELIWLQRCANCHGLEGDGGIGPKLADGEVAKKYEDPAAEKSIIQNGLNNNEMPAFKEILTDEEIDAVIAYTRDVL